MIFINKKNCAWSYYVNEMDHSKRQSGHHGRYCIDPIIMMLLFYPYHVLHLLAIIALTFRL